MYELGEQFQFSNSRSQAIATNILKGNKYRFTILSERLIRLEYSEEGVFEDRPTELVWYRDMPKVDFKVKEDNKFLEITTSILD